MEEAFQGPLVAGGGVAPAFTNPQKLSKHKRRKDGDVREGFAVPPPPDRQVTPPAAPEVLKGPSAAEQRPAGGPSHQLDSGVQLQDFFPLPGETADTEEWAKAFTLEPSTNPGIPVPRFDGSISVAGKPTLWRQVPVPHVAPNELAPAQEVSALAPAPSEVTRRLDALTRQLESLTTPTAAQGTAELFLFVAIGLLLLLAIDTLLRFAAGLAQRGGARGRGGRGGGRTVRIRS